jgi:SAM-dependent methyltransferase
VSEPRTQLLSEVAAYYSAKLGAHGATAAGADWNSPESQRLRFVQIAKLFEGRAFSVNDYGCGYGALADFLAEEGYEASYCGFDIAADMIAAAAARWPGSGRHTFAGDRGQLRLADYTVSSGIFNVKFERTSEAWLAYILETLDHMASLSTSGFAFNVLTSYSDPDKRRDNLYYADPLFLFDYCKRRYSKRVSLLHDYPLYEFTIVVRL